MKPARLAGMFLPALALSWACSLKPGVEPPQPPEQPRLSLRVDSLPPGARVFQDGNAIGSTPLELPIVGPDEALRIHAEHSDLQLVERRLRFFPTGDYELVFTFGTEPTALARLLGLSRILVFDTSGSTLFDVNRSELKLEAQSLLARQAELLAGAFRELSVHVLGHTDSTGSDRRNRELSLERALAVKAFLVERGIESSRLAVQGLGPDFPVADNATPAGRELNRRAEIVLPDN